MPVNNIISLSETKGLLYFHHMQNIVLVIINGIIEGLTEFIPVSSTGHLIIFDAWFPLHSDNTETFQIAIQLGAIMAVVVYYKTVFFRVLSQLKTNVTPVITLIVAMIPAFTVAFFAYDLIKTTLFNPTTVALALIVGGIAMVIIDKFYGHQRVTEDYTHDQVFEKVSISQALAIGVAQVLSLWPGMSRSATTIMGGVVSGLPYKMAADFSFLLAMPVISVAVCYDMLKMAHALTHMDIIYILIGFVVSFFVGLMAITAMIRWIPKWHLTPFGIYRILLGMGVLVLL